MSNFKIGLCYMSIGEKYKHITRYSKENKINYCKKYGYTFIEDESVYDPSKPIPWTKIPLILKYIEQYDFIVWVDADILIMNTSIPIEHYISKYMSENVDIVCGSDWKMTNTGVMIIRNTEFSKNFLKDVYSNIYDPNSDPNGRYMNWEQGSFIHLHDKNHMNCNEKIVVTYPMEMNSYWFNYHPGNFVLHFAGVRGELLEYLLQDYYPDRLDIDTDESYEERMKWLAGPVRDFLDEKLRHEKEDEQRRIAIQENKNIDIPKIELVSSDEYNKIISYNKHHFDSLLSIVKESGELLESDSFYYHNTFDLIPDCNKQINLFSLSKM